MTRLDEDTLTQMETRRTHALQLLHGLCDGSHSFTMSIPARPEIDTDLVLGSALKDGQDCWDSLRDAYAEIDVKQAEIVGLTLDYSLLSDDYKEAQAAFKHLYNRLEMCAEAERIE